MNLKQIILISSIFIVQFAFAGNETGNGGDAIQDEFVKYCRFLSTYLKKQSFINLDTIPNFSMKEFENTCDPKKTNITSTLKNMTLTDSDLKLEQEKDAINNKSTKSIKIQRYRWLSLPIRLRLRLSLHESFGYIGVDDKSFKWSNLFLNNNINIQQNSVSLYGLNDDEFKNWRKNSIENISKAVNYSMEYMHTNEKELEYLSKTSQDLIANSFGNIKQENDLKYLLNYQEDLKGIGNTRSAVSILRELLKFTVKDMKMQDSKHDIDKLKLVANRAVHLYHKAYSKREAKVLLTRSIYLLLDLAEQLEPESASKKQDILALLLEANRQLEHESYDYLVSVTKILKQLQSY